MGNRGRKHKPARIHELNGNPSKRDITEKLNFEDKIEKFIEYPEAPDWIKKDEIAFNEWNRIAPELVKLGLLTKMDITAFESYCKNYSRYREAEEEIDKLGKTWFKSEKSNYVQQLPQVAISHNYLKLCKDFMTEFGLTPSARNRMELPSEKESNEMEDLLKGDF